MASSAPDHLRTPGLISNRPCYEGINVDKDETYSLYVSQARQPLRATYVRTEDLEGLEVMVFQISASDRPMGSHPTLGLPLVADSEITLWVEPNSGRVVDVDESATTVSAVHPTAGKLTVFVSAVDLTDKSVSEQVEAAKDDKSQLTLYGTTIPYVLIVVGILAAVAGIVVLVLGRTKAASETV